MHLLSKSYRRLRQHSLLAQLRSWANRYTGRGTVASPLLTPVGDTYRGEKAAKYLDTRRTQHYWHLEQEVVRRLLDRYGDGIKVLDVPFGTGRFAPYYFEKKMVVHGLDSSPDMLKVASRELGANFDRCNVQLGDAQHLPYEDCCFDLVVCFRFLSHVVSFQQAKTILREFYRVTNSSALLQFRVRREDAPPAEEPKDDEVMGDRLSLAALTALLNESGFRVADVEPLEDRGTYSRAVLVCEKQ
jgi:SAM-dependent methyltransferase